MPEVSIAFFGKMPSAADFVRRGVSKPVLRDFENWFHDAYTELRRTGARGLAHRCHMLLPHRNGSNGIVAALAVPSNDRIGREFPIVVAVYIPRETLPQSTAAVGIGLTRFWEAATSAIEQHRDGEPEVMWEALRSLSLPTVSELSDAEERCQELLKNLGARQMEAECFSDDEGRFYAYHTLRLAVRDTPEGRVLMCPSAGHPGYRAFWVEAVERATLHKIPLPVVWLNGADAPGDTLVALSKAPAGMLRYLARDGRQSSTVWPLTTGSAAARERAKSALESAELSEAEQKLSRLIDVVLSTEL
jgi:type VI secretion system protein ImpM